MKINQQAQSRQAHWELQQYKRQAIQEKNIRQELPALPEITLATLTLSIRGWNIKPTGNRDHMSLENKNQSATRFSARSHQTPSLKQTAMMALYALGQLPNNGTSAISTALISSPASMSDQISSRRSTAIELKNQPWEETRHADSYPREERIKEATVSRNNDATITRKRLCKELGLSASASDAQIDTAYHRFARIHHPDRGGDELTMGRMNALYSEYRRNSKA